MARYMSIVIDGGGQVGIWKVTESLLQLESAVVLSEGELETYRKFRTDERKREWLAVRCLLQEMLGFYVPVQYLPSGKPWIAGWYISISHTKGYVGVSLAKKPTAIDLEYPSSRVEPLANRFVSPGEMDMVEPQNKVIALLLIWSAKEVLYKLYDRKGVVFNQDLYVQGLVVSSKGSMLGGIKKDGFMAETELFFQIEDDLIIVYC